jgi:hypothetical protein
MAPWLDRFLMSVPFTSTVDFFQLRCPTVCTADRPDQVRGPWIQPPPLQVTRMLRGARILSRVREKPRMGIAADLWDGKRPLPRRFDRHAGKTEAPVRSFFSTNGVVDNSLRVLLWLHDLVQVVVVLPQATSHALLSFLQHGCCTWLSAHLATKNRKPFAFPGCTLCSQCLAFPPTSLPRPCPPYPSFFQVGFPDKRFGFELFGELLDVHHPLENFLLGL